MDLLLYNYVLLTAAELFPRMSANLQLAWFLRKKLNKSRTKFQSFYTSCGPHLPTFLHDIIVPLIRIRI